MKNRHDSIVYCGQLTNAVDFKPVQHQTYLPTWHLSKGLKVEFELDGDVYVFNATS